MSPKRAALKCEGVPLLKIGSRQCRWIVSQTFAPAICCGARTDGGSWCPEHRARVLVRVAQPQPTKAREKARSLRF